MAGEVGRIESTGSFGPSNGRSHSCHFLSCCVGRSAARYVVRASPVGAAGASDVVRCSAGPASVGISGKPVAELWEAARGAPPGAVLYAAAAVYKVAYGLLVPTPPPRRREEPDEAVPPAPEPVEVGEITEEELRRYDGSDPEKPPLMAIKGQIYRRLPEQVVEECTALLIAARIDSLTLKRE